MSTALLTDRYELTMVEAAERAGLAQTPCVFEVFGRKLPTGRRYGVVAGMAQLRAALEDFHFGIAEIDELRSEHVVSEATLASLSNGHFAGRIHALTDGDLWFPHEPLLRLEGTFADAVVLETLVLSVLNHACAVASAASHMRRAAGARTLIEMGGRRVHPEAAVNGAVASYIGGFDATSNLEAGRRWDVPTAGTAAHASVLLAISERAAFDAQLAALGVDTTLLVDTYDIADGVRAAVAAANALGHPGPGAIRIDSGDPRIEVPAARALLDELGASSTRIVLSGDLDIELLGEYAALPIDGYGIGTAVATGDGAPAAGLVYKLVEVDGRIVEKRSADKESRGGAKTIVELRHIDGAVAERAVMPVELAANAVRHDSLAGDLLPLIWHGGPVGTMPSAADARERHRRSLDSSGRYLDRREHGSHGGCGHGHHH